MSAPSHLANDGELITRRFESRTTALVARADLYPVGDEASRWTRIANTFMILCCLAALLWPFA
jgi:hypothetical protein